MDSIMQVMTDPESVNTSRKDVLNTTENGWTVDTCCAFDTHIWETGIYPPNSGNCVIVEKYPSGKEDAIIGHEKWVKLMRENPNRKLPDLDVFTDEDLSEDEEDDDDDDEIS